MDQSVHRYPSPDGLRVLLASSEAHPLIKTGGLADVAGSLPLALRELGQDARLILPAYPRAARQLREPRTLCEIKVPGARTGVRILGGSLPDHDLPVYLVDAPEHFAREGNPYTDLSGRDWGDNAERFLLFSRVVAQLAQGLPALGWRPEVLHTNDWQTGLAPALLQGVPGRPATVFTIHNLAYQGLFPAGSCAELGLPEALFNIDGLEYHGLLSFMKAGLQFADAITTVSPRYAQEITTAEQGCGLDGALRARQDRLSGILNGVDYELWNPATDPLLKAHFDVKRMRGKASAKRTLQRLLGLEERADALLFAAVTRLTEQKGLHLVPPILPDLIERGGQLVILGDGDTAIETALREALACHPGQAVLRIGYDEALAHRIIAGADVILVPSRFEPCGLTQMYGLRYGALPLVHAVGGLADTVTDCSLDAIDDASASGFVFHDFSSDALRGAMRRAFALRRRPADWNAVQGHAMQQRFDWQEPAQAYRALYQRLLVPAGTSAPPVPA